MTDAPKAKIYTRTGDKGNTRLVDGSCVEKFNPRVEAYGTVDELNSSLGVVRASLTSHKELADLDAPLEKIQNELFNIGSLLATEKDEVFKLLPPITEEQIKYIEHQIDELTVTLPELRNFILPAGHPVSAYLHVSRTSCRRAERRSAEIAVKDERYAATLQYLNRLSDYLFVAARWANMKTGHHDVLWKKT
ncbi:cob(I)yrinic acid a,c-diamide adenosyltransferase [Bdellovibrio sp. 22V]|uniref:cob(I)yrinic acid a,c-diamide adenosyltransferase n=1 Tax=Bdellovibrio sp. 22V TaxID=3044166 RepID=UPI0025438AB3|nr:cob(I)yrinic acid a,c-diamide adenosyltransferase [Bdellovibrio sp. 22V]WII71923.1 cob(I)yrinic acid a,c-diamide adenosyltransferase [Bdellovibrio sp. 22V]